MAAGLTIGVRAYHGVHRLNTVAERLGALQSRAAEFRESGAADFTVIEADVAAAGAEIAAARGELTPLLQLSPVLGWVPAAGPRLSAAADGLAFASELVGGLRTLVIAAVALQDAVGASAGLLEGDTLNPQLLAAVRAQVPHFEQATRHFSNALTMHAGIDLDRLPPDLGAALAGSAPGLTHLQQLSRVGATLGNRAHTIFGYDSPKTYLVLAQNSDELRATGGFIPGAWIVTWDAGRLARLDFWDTVDVDRVIPQAPFPPEGLLVSLWAGTWLFRDAAWFPDFPTSAGIAQRFFESGPGIKVDGVVGMNQWAVVEIVGALGGVTLPDGGTLTKSSYLAVLEERTDLFGRGFIDTILRAMFDRLRSQPEPAATTRLLAAFASSFDHKDLLLSFADPVLQTSAQAANWDGAVRAATGDYLMLVDSNVGINKVNRNITLSIDYAVSLEGDGTGEGRLQLFYANHSAAGETCAVQGANPALITYAELKNACYWNYVRVYVPRTARLLEATSFPMPAGALYQRLGYADIADTFVAYPEAEKQVFAGLLTVEPQAARAVAFSYALPEAGRKVGTDLAYTLYLQKQPGLRAAQVRVAIRPPVGYELHRANLPATTTKGGEILIDEVLDGDLAIELLLRRS